MDILTNISLNNEFNHKFKLKSKKNKEIPKSALDGIKWESKTLITQDYLEANKFNNIHDIGYKFKQFDPHGKWVGININKTAVRWKEIPLQFKLDEKVHSSFKNFNLIRSGDYLIALVPSNIDGIIICFAMTKENDRGLVEKIKKSLTKEFLIEVKKYLLIPHIRKKFTRKVVPLFQSNIKNTTLECVKAIDHYNITIDGNGIEVNNIDIEPKIKVRSKLVDYFKLDPNLMWIEDTNNNRILLEALL